MPDAQTQDQQQSLPTIAPINKSTLDASSAAYKAIQDAIPPEVKITASPYSSGSEVTPTLPQAQVRGMVSANRQPFNDSLGERNHARNTNTWASVSNTITQFRNKQEQDKNAALTTSIATVMKAQQQIDNANAVLKSPTASDQDKQMAQGVIEQNKKVIEGKLTDPKSGKSILKAFDVSMSDPESQKTPEHQAAKAAAKQVAVATKAGLTADTPAEKAIQDKVTGADAAGQVQKAQQSAKVTQAAKNPSATPYADRFLGSQPASIGGNPEYAAQMKQKEDRDKLVTQYVIPKMFEVQMNILKTQIQQEGLNNRAEYAGTVGMAKEAKLIASTKEIASAHDRTQLSKQGMENSSRMMQTIMRTDALLAISMDTKLDATGQEKAKNAAVDTAEKNLSSSLTQLTAMQNAKAQNKYTTSGSDHAIGDPIDKNLDATLDAGIKIQQLAIEQAQKIRDSVITKAYGTATIGDTNGTARTNTPITPATILGDNAGTEDRDDGSTAEDEQTEQELINGLPYQ